MNGFKNTSNTDLSGLISLVAEGNDKVVKGAKSLITVGDIVNQQRKDRYNAGLQETLFNVNNKEGFNSAKSGVDFEQANASNLATLGNFRDKFKQQDQDLMIRDIGVALSEANTPEEVAALQEKYKNNPNISNDIFGAITGKGNQLQDRAGQLAISGILNGSVQPKNPPTTVFNEASRSNTTDISQESSNLRSELTGGESSNRVDAKNETLGPNKTALGLVQMTPNRMVDLGGVQEGLVIQDGVTSSGKPKYVYTAKGRQEMLSGGDISKKYNNGHFDLLRKEVEPFANKYIGKEINGTKVTMNGILAAGHLGGAGGVKKYLETGGEYNPHDGGKKKVGTRLSDYMKKYGSIYGEEQPKTAQQNTQQLFQGISNRLQGAKESIRNLTDVYRSNPRLDPTTLQEKTNTVTSNTNNKIVDDVTEYAAKQNIDKTELVKILENSGLSNKLNTKIVESYDKILEPLRTNNLTPSQIVQKYPQTVEDVKVTTEATNAINDVVANKPLLGKIENYRNAGKTLTGTTPDGIANELSSTTNGEIKADEIAVNIRDIQSYMLSEHKMSLTPKEIGQAIAMTMDSDAWSDGVGPTGLAGIFGSNSADPAVQLLLEVKDKKTSNVINRLIDKKNVFLKKVTDLEKDVAKKNKEYINASEAGKTQEAIRLRKVIDSLNEDIKKEKVNLTKEIKGDPTKNGVTNAGNNKPKEKEIPLLLQLLEGASAIRG